MPWALSSSSAPPCHWRRERDGEQPSVFVAGQDIEGELLAHDVLMERDASFGFPGLAGLRRIDIGEPHDGGAGGQLDFEGVAFDDCRHDGVNERAILR